MSSKGQSFAALLLLAWTAESVAAGLVLDRALVSSSSAGVEVEVQLSCAYRYVDHTPHTAARRVRVSLAPLDDCATSLGAGGSVREASRPAGRELASLDELEFLSRAGAGASLTLLFSRAVTIEVRQRGDLRSVVVNVMPADFHSDDLTVLPSINPPPGDNAADPELTRTPERLRRADERARQATQAKPAVQKRGQYVINLESALEPVTQIHADVVETGVDWQFYTADAMLAGTTWHRLRVGFFATEAAAEQALASLRQHYPRAWVTKVPTSEHLLADSATLDAGVPGEQVTAQPSHAPAKAVEPGVATLDVAKLQALMDDGRTAMIAADYPRAIQLYTRALREPEHPHSRDALEFLGLARERNGQKAHAVAEYRRFLELYPEGEGADRVSQRLAGLTALAPPRAANSGQRARRPRRESRWEMFGGLSQYYRLDETQFNEQPRLTSQSSILTDADLMVRRRGERTLFTSRVTLGNLYDLLGEDEGPGSSTRVYYLYADLQDEQTGLGARVGRQSLRTSGVLGRFDGAQLSWQWRPNTRFNIQSGFPVESSGDSIDTDRVFYGFSVDLLDMLETVDLNLFYNTQEVNGIDDREAVGGELRYYDSSRALIAHIDYDVSYSELNSLTVLGNWASDNRVTINAMLDQRKSPFLLTRNALIGQPFGTIEELLLTLTEDELRQLAADRTGDVQALALGVSLPLFERFQLNADVTLNEFGGTPASGGVAAVPDAGTEYFYSLNLIGSSLLKEGDSSIVGLRYAEGTNATTTSIYINTRYPVTRGLRINPRLRLSHREFVRDDSSEWIAAPAIRILYRFSRHYSLELETGGEWSSRDLENETSDFNSFFIFAGYRADF